MMKFEVIRSETVKPSSPTPHYLKHFKLSLLDQLAPVAYKPLVLFYPYNDRDVTFAPSKRSLWMKKSLSETLTRFYPFAGRIKGNTSIECNDDGVDYVEAHVHGLLSNLLAQPDAETLRQLLPVESDESPKSGKGSLLLVQVNFFDCGGLAVGVCMSRKLGDAASLSTFLMSWGASALGFSRALLPDFNASFRFPPMDCSSASNSAMDHIIQTRMNGCVTKRFVFDASNISALRTKAASENVKQPTNSEAITALIWRCAVAAASGSSLLHKSPPQLSVLSQSVDIRKRVVPPLSDDSIGNLVGYFAAQTNGSELELEGLVAQLRKGLNEVSKNCARRLKGSHGSQINKSLKEAGDFIQRDDIMNLHVCTGLSDYKVLYEVNFGWGRPIWVANIHSGLNRNVASLVCTREDDGLEAWVTLSEADMAAFEQNQELLAFAVVNPSVLEPIALKSAL